MSGLEARYRRLLRWYPPSWREQHGEVLIGTALNAAEDETRARPAAAEVTAMILHGMAERVTLRVALGMAVVAMLCAVTAQLTLITMTDSVAQWGGAWVPFALGAMSALCQTAALLALLRHTGHLRADRLVPLILVACLGWTFTFLTAWSWSVAFDRADAGLADTAFSGAFTTLLVGAWTLGAVAVAILILELTPTLPPAARAAAAVAAGLVCPPVLGAIAVSASTEVLSSLAVLALCIRMITERTVARSRPAIADSPLPRDAVPLRRGTGLVALVCAVIGLAFVIFAFTGGGIAPTVDSTRAMQLGLGAGALTGIPMLGVAGARLAARRPTRRVHIWSGVTLLGAGLCIHALSTMTGAVAGGDLPWSALSPAAAGVGLLTWSVTRAPGGMRVLLAAAAAAGSIGPLWIALVCAGLLFPPTAAVVAARGLIPSAGRRDDRRQTTAVR